MKKKLLLITFCLLTMFVFLGNVNAEEDDVAYSSNPYLERDDGFDKCTSSGYEARECITKCSGESFEIIVNFNSFIKVLEDPLQLDKECDEDGNRSILCRKDLPYTTDYKTFQSEESVSESDLRKSNGWTLYENWFGGNVQKKKGLLAKPAKGYTYVIKHPTKTSKALVCKDNDKNYIFECDMKGSGSDFRVYMKGESGSYKDYGHIRNFNRVYDPDGLDGWFDGVMQKVTEALGKETNVSVSGKTTIKKYIKVCMDENTANRKNLIDAGGDDLEDFKDLDYCIDFGKQSFQVIRKDAAKENTYPGCYSFLHKATGSKPFYNTTVWTKFNMNNRCGLKTERTWDRDACKNADLTKLHKVDYGREVEDNTECEGTETPVTTDGVTKCYRTVKITNSGYNGVASFYDVDDIDDPLETECKNFQGLHIIYRVIIISAPILVIFFVTFDLIRSIMSGDEKKMAKFKSSVIRRLIALIILILLPVIVRILVESMTRKSSYDNASKPSLIKCMVLGKTN